MEFSCLGKKYSMQLANIESDTSIWGFHGYYRNIRFEDLKGVLSINCQTDTEPNYFEGEDYIHLYDSANVKIGVAREDSSYQWKEMLISDYLVVNYICKEEGVSLLDQSLLSIKKIE
ncbi:hypothetical protein [Fulvivirga lutimaris]|uniref:hypothetical protein n=1 Tax=Fulvivirga lutimaris TaxID=1819566 RepID=UPI0012BC50AD|nr:hypothetical protein [Fulvivirga lutimaris]